MIEQDIYINRVGWHVKIFHEADKRYADQICYELFKAGCGGDNLSEAEHQLYDGLPNIGLTYSNLENRETIMVIGKTTSGSEYWNTLQHEMDHLKQHIIQSCNVDPLGEEICYISGEFIRSVYNRVSFLLCDCCRSKKHH